MKVDSNSLERIVPDQLIGGEDTGRETLRLHLQRYEFAVRHIRPGRLLDIACGVGYGADFLANQSTAPSSILGIDISPQAIDYARERYANSRVQFRVGDAYSFSDSDGFDTIVSLETIEHLPDPDRFVDRCLDQLHPNGVFIGSVPTTPSTDVNPHHLRDFTERTFRKMFERHGLVEVGFLRQIQTFHVLPLLKKQETRAKDLRANLFSYYLTHPHSFFRRIWSTLRYGFANRYITIAWKTPE